MAELKHTLMCEVISPERTLYRGEVDMVVGTAVDGEIGILPLHIPLVTLLGIGELRLKKDDEWTYIAIYGGYLEVREDRVTVLAELAELASQIDLERAEQAKEEAQKRVVEARKKVEAEEDFYAAEEDLRQALTRLQVARKVRQ